MTLNELKDFKDAEGANFKNEFNKIAIAKIEIEILKNDIESLNDKVKSLEMTNLLLTKKISVIEKNFERNSNSNSKKVKVNFHDYLPLEARPQKRAFEVYEVVRSYFKVMIKLYDKKLQREILNNLLVEYGENLAEGSFEIYCTLLNKSEEESTSTQFLTEFKELLRKEKLELEKEY
jgi:hypothetical protein